MRFRFGISTIVLLIIVAGTGVAWIGFEFYHRRSNVDIPQELTQHVATPLPTSFDQNTLNKLYQGKDNFYEYQEGSAVSE